MSADTQGFKLAASDASFIANGNAEFKLEIEENDASAVVRLAADQAAGLKAAYASIAYDARAWTPVSVEHTEALDPNSVLAIEVLDEPGLVHLGQVIADWESAPGLDGSAVLAEVHFAAEAFPKRQACEIVPDTDAARFDLGWDSGTGTLSWAYTNPGDYNQDGFVTVNDLTPLGQHFNAEGPFDAMSAMFMVDGNGDGLITVNDLTPIGVNYSNAVTGYRVFTSKDAANYPTVNTSQTDKGTLAGQIEFSAAESGEGLRKRFAVTLADWETDDLFWVRPYNDNLLGTPSEMRSTADFGVSLEVETQAGEVPLYAQCTASPVGDTGAPPYSYDWHIYSEAVPTVAPPVLDNPPALSAHAAALVVPGEDGVADVFIGNTGEFYPNYWYAVTCEVTDSLGLVALSEPLWIEVQENSTYEYYYCQRPQITHEMVFPTELGSESAQGALSALVEAEELSPRLHPAICNHPTGITFILGGETANSDGGFSGLVSTGDSAYCYVPPAAATGVTEVEIGKYETIEHGYLVRLNDARGPAYPGSPETPFSSQWPNPDGDTVTPIQVDPENQPAAPPPMRTQRSAKFDIVGSAAAVFMHEPPETNPAGLYPERGTWASSEFTVGTSRDRDYNGFPDWQLWSWPDGPTSNWGLDNWLTNDGLGTAAIYVLGGRTETGTPTADVQKYYPFGFGTEDLVPWSQDYEFQVTGNQVDIWSPYFLRPDTDQFPGESDNFLPQIPDRLGTELPKLPQAVYGLAAVRVESGVDIPWPEHPEEPYSHIFIFGGIDETGATLAEVRVWDTRITGEPGTTAGVFSAVDPLPQPRAYASAVVLPGDPLRIAVSGGFDADGEPLNTIEVYTFDSLDGSISGSWQSFDGMLPEGVVTSGLAFDDSSGDRLACFYSPTAGTPACQIAITNAALGTPVAQLEVPPLIPLFAAHTTQTGSQTISDWRQSQACSPLIYNRILRIGGLLNGEYQPVVTIVGIP